MTLYLIDEGDSYTTCILGLFRGASDPQNVIDKYNKVGKERYRQWESVRGKIERANPLPDPRKDKNYQEKARTVFAKRQRAIEAKIGPEPKTLKQRLLDAGFEEVEYINRRV